MGTERLREVRHDWKKQVAVGRILGLQTGENAARLPTDELRKHLYALLDDPTVVERGLPGCVITEYKRCGRARCRCTRGQLHGPYHYWYGRMLGLTWKRYLKRAEAPRVMALCRLRREKHVTRERLRFAMRFLKERWRYLDEALESMGR